MVECKMAIKKTTEKLVRAEALVVKGSVNGKIRKKLLNSAPTFARIVCVKQ